MKESLHTPEDRRIIFRETFQDEYTVRRNGGEVTNVTFENGKAAFAGVGSGSLIQYPTKYTEDTGHTYRIKANFNTVAADIALFAPPSGTVGRVELEFSANRVFINTGANINLDYSGVIGSLSADIDYEIVVVVDAANTKWRLYINGVFQDDVNGASKVLPIACIGAEASSSRVTDGSIELAEVYNYALTAEEVSNLYEGKRFRAIGPLYKQEFGAVLNTSACANLDFTTFAAQGTDGFDATSDGAGVDVAGTADEIAVTVGIHLEVTFDLTINGGSATDLRVNINESLGGASWVAAYQRCDAGANSFVFVPTSSGTGVVQWYVDNAVIDYEVRNIVTRLVGSDNVKELFSVSGQSGSMLEKYGRAYTDSGHSIRKDGEVNTLFFSDGSGGIDFTPAGDIKPETFTVALWTKRSGNSGTTVSNREIVGISSGAAYGWGIAYFELAGSPKFWFTIDDDGTGAWDHYVEPDDVAIDNKWYFIVCTFDGTDMEMYINDVQQSGGMVCSDVYYRVSHDPVTIGKYRDGGSRYYGSINDTRIWEGALSRQILSQLWSKERIAYQV